MVFKKARERKIPIVMLTSGGYLKKTARIIGDSILNLHEHSLISLTDKSLYQISWMIYSCPKKYVIIVNS